MVHAFESGRDTGVGASGHSGAAQVPPDGGLLAAQGVVPRKGRRDCAPELAVTARGAYGESDSDPDNLRGPVAEDSVHVRSERHCLQVPGKQRNAGSAPASDGNCGRLFVVPSRLGSGQRQARRGPLEGVAQDLGRLRTRPGFIPAGSRARSVCDSGGHSLFSAFPDGLEAGAPPIIRHSDDLNSPLFEGTYSAYVATFPSPRATVPWPYPASAQA